MKNWFFAIVVLFSVCFVFSAPAPAAEDAQAMGTKVATTPAPASITPDSRFTIDDSELNSANPNVKVIAVGSFSSKSDIEDGFRAKMAECIRTYGTLWREKSSELRVDGRAYQANNGRPLANVKIYFVERRFPEGGIVVKKTTPKVTPIGPGAPPAANGQPVRRPRQSQQTRY